ncbi:formin-like protein 5 isoform X2 [Pteropus medius]|uniref:formin-like protein 5 isoform X2 n=1 Tax=Pteropus vampyrus TaxID=132908 RepID=UPI00196ABBBD|nr:formin-like protein 5 isoform X2 [Pteropus giganteus]
MKAGDKQVIQGLENAVGREKQTQSRWPDASTHRPLPWDVRRHPEGHDDMTSLPVGTKLHGTSGASQAARNPQIRRPPSCPREPLTLLCQPSSEHHAQRPPRGAGLEPGPCSYGRCLVVPAVGSTATLGRGTAASPLYRGLPDPPGACSEPPSANAPGPPALRSRQKTFAPEPGGVPQWVSGPPDSTWTGSQSLQTAPEPPTPPPTPPPTRLPRRERGRGAGRSRAGILLKVHR